MRKRVNLTIISTRPRQFAAAVASALRKKNIDSFGGVPSDGVTPGDLLTGLPVNVSDPSGDPSADLTYALPSKVHQVDEDFLRPGDTIFEKLAYAGGTYVASLPVNYFRAVWFDGLAAERNDHYLMSGEAIAPLATLASGVSVTAKYVLAG